MRTQLTAWAIAAMTALGAAPAWAAHTPLVEAVKAGNQRAVLALIQPHVDVNAPEADGATALHSAVENADQKMVDLLIRNHANVQAANRQVTPLVLAATNGNDAIADALLRAGAARTRRCRRARRC
jgi:ankyrin repeat protein